MKTCNSDVQAFCDGTVNVIAVVIESYEATKTYIAGVLVHIHPSLACYIMTSVFDVRQNEEILLHVDKVVK